MRQRNAASRGSVELIVLGVFVVAVVALVGWRITVAMNDQADAEDAVASQQNSVGLNKNGNNEKRSLSIAEWGVGGTYEGTTALRYVSVGNDEAAYLTSDELVAAAPNDATCGAKAGTSLDDETNAAHGGGVILKLAAGVPHKFAMFEEARTPEEFIEMSVNPVYAKIDTSYYVYLSEKGPCSQDTKATAVQGQTAADAEALVKKLEKQN